MKKLFAMILTCMMVLSAFTMTAAAAEATPTAAPEATAETTTAPEATPTVAPAEADPYSGVGCYMAFVNIQTTTWVYRNYFEDKAAGYGTDIFKTIYNNETSAPTTTEIQDAVLDGDGEYTIALNNISLEGSTDWNMVGISTNIPLDSGISITAATLKYGDKTVTSTPVQKADNKKYVQIMMINQYDKDMKDTVNTMVPVDGSNMTITFTVSGFGYAKAVEEAAVAEETETAVTTTEETTAADTTADTSSDTTANDTAASADSADSGLSTGALIGIIAGVALVLIVIVVVVLKKNKKA